MNILELSYKLEKLKEKGEEKWKKTGKVRPCKQENIGGVW